MKKAFNWLLTSDYGYLILVVLIVLITNIFVNFNFVEGISMNPTLMEGDLIISDNASIWLRSIKRGDIVIADPNNSPVLVIKRVVGVPGDTISFSNGQMSVNGEALNEDYIIDKVAERTETTIDGLVLGEGEYFIVGDNRNFSYDSLDYGPVYIDYIEAKVLLHLGW